MTKVKHISTSRKEILARISRGVADCETVIIKLDGSTGRVSITVSGEIVARFSDVYEAVNHCLPAMADEVLG